MHARHQDLPLGDEFLFSGLVSEYFAQSAQMPFFTPGTIMVVIEQHPPVPYNKLSEAVGGSWWSALVFTSQEMISC